MITAEQWIQKLRLQPHPEGGFYLETYRAQDKITSPSRYEGHRCASTAIYYLLRSQDVSIFHRVRSDEIWHFYAGSDLTIHILHNGIYQQKKIGHSSSIDSDMTFQATVHANQWFGATVNNADSYSLVGCTVAPGFEFQDFEMAQRATLLEEYPNYKEIIEKLTKS